ncbi:RAS small GTPase [Aureococcus anophagefferens]|uniref:RAS small GTPase n=1 Tax=Aureococcus anophagefferens TaxID=44056 RepID=A0ABR1FP01_AURAN
MGDAKPAAALLKCVVLGSSNVGKTSLLMQFVHGKFTPARRVTTGADFASKVLHLGDREVRLVIWDTAGQERFHHGTLGGAFYRGADAALLVYDTTDIRTFEQIEMWRRELLQRIDGPPEEFPVVVVGNKVDVPNKTREHEQAAVVRWCRDLGIGLCLTSAKDGTGVAVAMEAVAMLALENKRRRQAAEPEQKRQTVVLDELHARPVARDASCCK